MALIQRAYSASETSDRESRFREIYGQHAGVVRRIIHRLCQGNDLDDLVQVAFLKVYEKMESLREQSSLRAWVCQIALHTALDHLRKKKRNAWLLFFAPAELPLDKRGASSVDDSLASDQ